MFSVGDLREVLRSHSRGNSIKSPIALMMLYVHRVLHREGVLFGEFGFLVLRLFIVGI
jgi:hypothetical protein